MLRTVFPSLLGNDALRRRFYDDIRAGTMFHAYIIEGATGSGRHTLVRQLVAALSCRQKDNEDLPLPCGNCSLCHKILSDNSPDVRYIRREKDKTGLGVDAIRFLSGDIAIAPNDSDQKVYIIENADTMTVQAQNALLLTLEEPPAYAMFFLLCENATLLLETIRSRAPVFRMEPLSLPLMREALRTDPDCHLPATQEETDGILQAAAGSLGIAKTLLQPKAAKQITALRRGVESFVALAVAGDNAGIIGFLGGLGSVRTDVRAQLEAILPAIRDLTVLKKDENAPLCFYTDREQALALSDRTTLERLVRCYDAVNDALRRIALLNGNIRLTLLRAFSDAGLL